MQFRIELTHTNTHTRNRIAAVLCISNIRMYYVEVVGSLSTSCVSTMRQEFQCKNMNYHYVNPTSLKIIVWRVRQEWDRQSQARVARLLQHYFHSIDWTTRGASPFSNLGICVGWPVYETIRRS